MINRHHFLVHGASQTKTLYRAILYKMKSDNYKQQKLSKAFYHLVFNQFTIIGLIGGIILMTLGIGILTTLNSACIPSNALISIINCEEYQSQSQWVGIVSISGGMLMLGLVLYRFNNLLSWYLNHPIRLSR